LYTGVLMIKRLTQWRNLGHDDEALSRWWWLILFISPFRLWRDSTTVVYWSPVSNSINCKLFTSVFG
jgi:hypothetical protein